MSIEDFPNVQKINEPTQRIKPSQLVFHLCIFAVALLGNCAGCILVSESMIPLYLDSILTIMVTATSGLGAGLMCAVLSNGILTIFDYTMLPFMSCHMLTSFLAWSVFFSSSRRKAQYGRMNGSKKYYEIDSFLWAGLWSALSNAILGNIISDVLFSSVTTPKIDSGILSVYTAVPNLVFATYIVGFLTNLTDKMISAVVSYAGYKLCIKLYDVIILRREK
ncbi:MAG: hypothetical protein J5747_07210 [Spirochaetaceae bacterium]|nr:hypothetical protein [Spirochaetaceae bacterium]